MRFLDFTKSVGRSISEAAGERDAAIGVVLEDEHVLSLFGPRPLAASEHLGTRHDQAALTIDTDEKAERLQEAEDRAAEYVNPVWLRLAIAALLACEFVAIAAALRVSFGMRSVTLAVLSAVLTVGSVIAAMLAFRPATSLLQRIAGAVFFVVLTLSIALIRQDEVKAALGTDPLMRVAATIIFLTMTLGPAVGTERLIEKLPESVRAWRIVKTLRSEIRADGKRVRKAEQHHDRRADDREQWETKVARARADYRRGYVHGRAKVGEPNNYDEHRRNT